MGSVVGDLVVEPPGTARLVRTAIERPIWIAVRWSLFSATL